MRRSIAPFLAIGLLIGGCSDNAEDIQVTQANIPLDSLSEFQQTVFADGEVTFAEYEKSFIELVGCIGERGVEVEGPILESDSTYSFITTESGGQTEQDIDAVVGACSTEFTSAVELGYADEIAPSAEDDRDFYSAVADCARSRGITIAGQSPAELDAARTSNPEVYDECFLLAIEDSESE